MSQLRTMMREYFSRHLKKGDDVALLYSGGFESFSCLITLLDMGIKPHLYTFVLKGVESFDVKKARGDAKIFDVTHTICEIPNDTTTLVNDVRGMIYDFGTARKTVIQCLHPIIYTIPQITENIVVMGIERGDIWGLCKNSCIAAKKGEEEFQRIRIEHINDDEYGSLGYIKRYFRNKEKTLLLPYDDDKIVTWFMSKTWNQLNKPRTKQPIRDDFEKEIAMSFTPPKQISYQIGSGIREFHNKLLDMETYNPNRKYKSVVAIYNRIKENKNYGTQVQLQLEF